MDAYQIYRGYCAQLSDGCDALVCDNEYCKSCPNFKFTEIKDNQELDKIALDLLKSHKEHSHLCKNLSPIQYNVDFLTKSKFPDISNLDQITTMDSNKVLYPLKSEEFFYSYILFKSPEDREKLKNDRLYFDDERLELFAQCVAKNREYFEYFPVIILAHVNTIYRVLNLEKSKSNNNENSKPSIQYHHIRIIFLNLFFASLFPPNDVSQLLLDTLNCIFHSDFQQELQDYLQSIFSKTPKAFSRVLTYTHDNITFASILNDKFSLNGEIFDEEDEYDESTRQEIKNMALFMNLLRKSNKSLPTRAFVNEVFTDNFITKYNTSDLLHFLRGQFSYLSYPSILTLKCKSEQLKLYFRFIQQPNRQNIFSDPYFNIIVHRDRLIEEAVQKLSNADPKDFLKRLRIKFVDEQGVDAGGVSREFFYLVCNEIFHIKYGMFNETPNGKYWFVEDTKLTSPPIYYTLMGTIIGLAIYNSTILPIRFPILMYKKLWGEELTLDDYAEIDPEIVTQLKNLLNMKKESPDFDISELDMMFYITQDVYGQTRDIELCEGGLEKKVTNENVEEYVDLYTNWLLNESVRVAFEKFQNGFNRVINAEANLAYPLVLRKLIAYDEVDILVSGEEIIHWEALKQNCQYSDGYNKNSQPVLWFWEIFDEMTSDEKQQFFRFSTGSDRAPVGGLHLFNLTIQKINDTNKLPVSHTCFNIFSLPNYSSKEEMKEKIFISLSNAEGFGLI